MSLKNRVRISSTLPIDLTDQLKSYSRDTMVPITKIMEKAIEEYLFKKRSVV